jgi:hypothetical protein
LISCHHARGCSGPHAGFARSGREHQVIGSGDIGAGPDPVLMAAAIAFGFVYIHPLMDGNGRIHRYLIHDVLAKAGFTPRGIVLPVSAVILASLDEYIATLEQFSRPINQLTHFDPDQPQLPATGNDAVYFRYPDLTAQAEFLYKALERTVTHDLEQEIDYLLGFDRAGKALNNLLDWPAHSLELFIRVVHENGGKLSANKRKSHFTWMRDDEIQTAEAQVVAAFNSIQDATSNRGHAMSQKYEKLKTLLRELFQLDQPDLDFGIYRIMHAKAGEVTQFLERDSAAAGQAGVRRSTSQPTAPARRRNSTRWLASSPSPPAWIPSRRPRCAGTARTIWPRARRHRRAGRAKSYDHLYSFFRRYYSEGDFLAKRVYKPGVYAIPYEGEEVTLHWANKDQYYIKTSEYLRDYAFRPAACDGRR